MSSEEATLRNRDVPAPGCAAPSNPFFCRSCCRCCYGRAQAQGQAQAQAAPWESVRRGSPAVASRLTGVAAVLSATNLQSKTILPKRSVPHQRNSNQEDIDKEDLVPWGSKYYGERQKAEATTRPTDFTYDIATRAEEEDRAAPAGFATMAANSDSDYYKLGF